MGVAIGGTETRDALAGVTGRSSALAGIAYTILTGSQVPTVRSCIASLLILGGIASGREALTLRLVATGALIILILWPEGERAALHVGVQRVQPGQHPGQLVSSEQPSGRQHAGVRPGTRDVVAGQPPVEVRRDGERSQRVSGATGEPAAPQAAGR